MKVLADYFFSKVISKFFCFLGLYILLIVNSYAAGFLELPHQVPYTDTAGITYDYVVQWTFGPSNWRVNYCKSSDNLPPALFSQNPTNPASIEIAWFSGSHCHFFYTNGDSTWYDYGVPASFPFVNGFWDIGLNLAAMVRSNVDIRYYDYETPSVGYDFQGNFGLHQVNPGDLLISASVFAGGGPSLPLGFPPYALPYSADGVVYTDFVSGEFLNGDIWQFYFGGACNSGNVHRNPYNGGNDLNFCGAFYRSRYYTAGTQSWGSWTIVNTGPFGVNGWNPLTTFISQGKIHSSLDIVQGGGTVPSYNYSCGNYNENGCDVIMQADVARNQVPPNVTTTPGQPAYVDLSPPITLTGIRKHLVLLTHGWNSNPDAWAVKMKSSIAMRLDPSYNDGDPCIHPVTLGNIAWYICTYDWKELANTGLLDPWTAYVNALNVGKSLATKIVYEQGSYDFIHFIAHSAGSQVADTAATWIPIFTGIRNNAQPSSPLPTPVVNMTFLDAFDPQGSGSPYGRHANHAEQYVDSRFVGAVGVEDFTNITLQNVYNFDVTALDPDPPGPAGIDAHAWPYKWYQSTIVNNNIVDYGFGISLEAGTTYFPPKNGKRCFFTSNAGCSEDAQAAKQVEFRVVVDDVLALPLDAAITSITGTVLFEQVVGDKVLKLITGSPAWASLPIEVTEPIDSLSFDYTYLRQAEGLLSVFLDNQLVFKSDQRVELAGLNHSDNVPIGAIASGAHTLSFRLDAFNNTQSEIDLSHIQLGKMEVSEQVDTTSPVITPTVSGTQGNNGWYKSDVTVSWTVVDSESAITTQSGCGTTAVTTDTSGVTFTCSATSGGGTASKSVTIRRDATPPTLTGSASPAANANGWRNSAVTVSFTCNDVTSGIATCTAPQTLGEGANQSVSGTATDKAGNAASTQFTGINVDTTPPSIQSVTANPNTLWPPNHKMVPVKVTATASDLYTAAPVCKISSVASNEPVSGTDKDDQAPDWQITGALTANLRAERAGNGSGRVYTLTVQCTDQAENSATKNTTVTVPHDRGKN